MPKYIMKRGTHVFRRGDKRRIERANENNKAGAIRVGDIFDASTTEYEKYFVGRAEQYIEPAPKPVEAAAKGGDGVPNQSANKVDMIAFLESKGLESGKDFDPEATKGSYPDPKEGTLLYHIKKIVDLEKLA